VSSQRHAPAALTPGNYPILIVQEAWWASWLQKIVPITKITRISCVFSTLYKFILLHLVYVKHCFLSPPHSFIRQREIKQYCFSYRLLFHLIMLANPQGIRYVSFYRGSSRHKAFTCTATQTNKDIICPKLDSIPRSHCSCSLRPCDMSRDQHEQSHSQVAVFSQNFVCWSVHVLLVIIRTYTNC
jgi:hypothetical protein